MRIPEPMRCDRDEPLGGVCSDYRASHLDKGACYDASLSGDAWSAYLAQQEWTILISVIKEYFNGRPCRCMDFACGTGRLTATLEGLVENCIGIDISSSMIEIARSKCKKASFLVCDLTREAPELGFFNLITAFRFFGNAQDQLRIEVLSALHRYLDYSGYLILNNHRNPLAIQNILHRWTGGKSNMDLTLSKLTRHAESCGFDVVDVYGMGCWSLRHRWQSWVQRPLRRVRILEGMTRLRALATFAPDWIVVLRKRRTAAGWGEMLRIANESDC
jgi:SAM-dependent methyltransferase